MLVEDRAGAMAGYEGRACYTGAMQIDERHVPDEPPPFLGTWRTVYTAILLYLAGLIVVFYIFMRAFS